MNINLFRNKRHPLTIALSVLLSTAALPAFAADPPCLNPDGTPKAGTTNQGNEHGDSNTTCWDDASAYGEYNNASGQQSSAFGYINKALGYRSAAIGVGNIARSETGMAFGAYNEVDGIDAQAFGQKNRAIGDRTSAFGYYNEAGNAESSAFGYSNTAWGGSSSAFGYTNEANGNLSNAFGLDNTANGDSSSAFGYANVAGAYGTSAFGFGNTASGEESSAFGYMSQALNIGSTAIGHSAVADRDYAVSVGKTGGEHQIIHLADGTEDTDAVNVRQLNGAIAAAGGFGDFSGLASAFGGGASWINGTFTAPTFSIQGNTYNTVFDAFAAVDGKLTALANAGGTQGPIGPQGPQGEQGPMGPQGPAGADGIGGMDKAYVDAGDAAAITESKSYADAKSASTLTSANAYTDSKFAAWNDSFTQFQQQVDVRFAQTDKRIDRQGAMSGAMASAAMNTAGLPGQNRVGVGVGAQSGRAALAIGYQRLLKPNVSVSLSGAFSGSERAVSAGAGFSW